MHYTGITPIDRFDNFYVKREDLAHWSSLEYPSGSKVRQYLAMAGYVTTDYGNGFKLSHLNQDMSVPPCLVGCSANSAMQVYVAAAAKQLNTQGIIYTAKRKVRSDATEYALRMGAEIVEVKPGYLSKIRKEARQRAIDLKSIVMWDRTKAIIDTVDQCGNLPPDIKRIVVPTGSGLTAAGILIGTSATDIEVVAVCTSPMADAVKILDLVKATINLKYPGHVQRHLDKRLTVVPPRYKYDEPVIDWLPDNTPLDPFYSAKAWNGYISTGTLFWPVGLRPVCSMPEVCQAKFQHWRGPCSQ